VYSPNYTTSYETFAYGPAGERALKRLVTTQYSPVYTATVVQTKYLHGSNDWPLVEYEETTVNSGPQPTKVTRYIYGPGGIVAIHKDSTMTLPLTDHIGSTRVVLSAYVKGLGTNGTTQLTAATVAEKVRYFPFGAVAGRSATGSEYLFTGQEYDSETGLHNFRARLMSGTDELGRFFSIPEGTRDPQAQFHSPYVYAANNPVNLTDPDGELVPFAFAAAVAIGAGMNIWTNKDDIHNFGDFLAYGMISGSSAAISTLGGPIAWMGAGFTSGSLNTLYRGGLTTENLKASIINGGLGSISGLAGGAAGNYVGKVGMGVLINGTNITSPVVQGGLIGGLSGFAGGYAGGFTAGLIITRDFSAANEMGWASGLQGGALGVGIGSGAAYKRAIDDGVNPLSGRKVGAVGMGRGQKQVDDFSRRMKIETIKENTLGVEWREGEKPAAYLRGVPNKNGLQLNQDFVDAAIGEKRFIYLLKNPVAKGYSPYYHGIEIKTINQTNYWSNTGRVYTYGSLDIFFNR
jgi:RHS repeat-associated protein